MSGLRDVAEDEEISQSDGCMDLKIFMIEGQVHHMNLMEQNHHTDEEENIGKEWEQAQESHGMQELLQKPYMTPILLGVIVILLICIIVLLVFMPDRRQEVQTDAGSDVQQNIADYANAQKQNDYVSGLSGETVSIEAVEEKETDSTKPNSETEFESESDLVPMAADGEKDPVVVAVEDESDASYSKEFILNEALPYFADNNQAAIWDLAHLKRYVKLSAELAGTNQYYYIGDVDSDGKPNGKGLAIYEDNSYYYGDWSDGVRCGDGRWFRFYINEESKRNARGIYTSHSYAGEWADDLPNGGGAEHFDVDITKIEGNKRIIQNVVGNFNDGLYDGEMFANTVDYKGAVDEWYGVCDNGVFELWKDMSSIGECSVWRNKDDHDMCLDIHKSENKNRGIRELWK